VSVSAVVPPATALACPPVVLDARLVGFAGIGRMIEGLWRGLVDIGAPVTGLWPDGAPRDWRGAHRAGPAGPHAAVRARPFLPAEQLSLPRVLRRLGARVHHAPYFAVPYLTRVPVVLTVHDLFPLLPDGNARSPLAASAYRAIIPAALRRANRVVAVSGFAARQLQEIVGLDPARVTVIGHGIDHDLWHPPGAARVRAVRAEHRLPADYLLYVGTLKRHKNLATVMAAHRPEHPPLVLAGAGPEELAAAGLQRASAGTVMALGRVSDATLAGLYAGARALVLPSLYEAVGFTALEAMACGTPVLASDGGGLPDTVGDAGLLVPARDAEAWGAALERIGADDELRTALVERGLARVQGRSWSQAARAYVRVYAEAAA
jgi:glycosyltransferase involved in cell wall biosynthesis